MKETTTTSAMRLRTFNAIRERISFRGDRGKRNGWILVIYRSKFDNNNNCDIEQQAYTRINYE